MISISGRHWKEIDIDKNKVQKIQQDNDFSDILSKLIVEKEFDKEEIFSIQNTTEFKNSFEKYDDFNRSVSLLVECIKKKEKICIFGDYDVDGSTATAILVRFFKKLKHPFFFYIPDRVMHGYGPSIKTFKEVISQKPKLCILVDCGSSSYSEIELLNKNKIKSLIIDHHQIQKPFPKANFIINPCKDNGYKKFDYLCATALTYFFLDLVIKKMKLNLKINDFLIYVLLATVCDVMPLRKLNRLIAIHALKNFDIYKNKIFKEIYDLNKKKNKITINDLGFMIGPILNAGGRLGKSNYACDLLSSVDDSKIKKISLDLFKLNEKRRLIENNIMKEIDFDTLNKNKNFILLYKNNINEGLIGIIAARLKDFFNKPSIVITNSGNVLKASARSIYGINIGLIIQNAVQKKILLKGGGHTMAAGFSLTKDMIDKFTSFLNQSISVKSLKIDRSFKFISKISSSNLNKQFYAEIKKLEPFGNGNMEPIFLFEKLKILRPRRIKNKHISCILKSNIDYTIDSFSFNSIDTNIGNYLLNYKKELNVVGQIKENIWNNKSSLQLIIKDLFV